MGTSNWQNIPFCVEMLMKIEPKRVLDIGVGFGRWGMIVREFCDVWFQRVFPEDWAVQIDGVEGFAKNIAAYHSSFYNKIHVGDAAELIPRLTGPWDVTIYGDVLEHFTKEKALELLRTSLANSGYVIVNIPLGEDWHQENRYENEFERHRSSWTAEEFAAFSLVRQAHFTDYSGREFGSFCLSREDPRDLGKSLFSAGTDCSDAYGLGVGQGGHLGRVRELADELGYIKNTAMYRRAVQLRNSSAWNALRWLRNRNRGLVHVRALGTRNPQAQGTEVWLLQARPNPNQWLVPWDFVERDPTWVERRVADAGFGKAYVSSQGRLRVPADCDPELRFLTDPRSGKVEVRFGGHSEVLDLYSPEGGTVTVRPAQTPMVADRPHCGLSAVAASAAGNSPAVPTGGNSFSDSETAWIESLRNAGARVLALYCPRWLGISNSTQALFEHTYAVPASPLDDPISVNDDEIRHHGDLMLATGIRHLVISGGDQCHLRIAEYLRRKDPGIRFDLLWHGSYAHFREDYAWSMLRQWVDAARAGWLHTLGVVKKGMEEFFQAAGLSSKLVLNYLPGEPLAPPPIAGEGKHIGIWLSGSNELKSPFAMLSALALVPGSRLHAAGLNGRAREVVDIFKIPVESLHEGPLAYDALLNAIRRTHLTLYVTLSECCPMLPLESMSVGVPCLIGPTSHLFQDNEYLFSRLVVPFPERADVIARCVHQAIEEREAIMAEYARYIPSYNEAARRSVEGFLGDKQMDERDRIRG